MILQEKLVTSDFDENGRCIYTITYQIDDTPKVSYAINALEGTTVTIDDISWWKES